jgi:hypothetical protein
MRPLRVLVTASGAPGTAALVRALRENGEREIAVLGCDMSGHAVGRRLCDAFQQVPPGSSPLFAPAVLELCHALGELDADEVAAHARLLRPTRKALCFFDQLEWDE